VQAIQDHLDETQSRGGCGVCSSNTGIKHLIGEQDKLVGLATALFVYAKGKQQLAQPLQVGDVPADYVRLAKNVIAAVFASSHLCAKGEAR
jgi:hypothetical protein